MQTPLITRQVAAAIEPVLAAQGFELVLVEFIPTGRILRLYIDRHHDAAATDAGITLEDCTAVSRLVGDLIDAEGVAAGPGGLAGRYTLEVSSPGLDRPLTRPEHYRRFVGSPVKVTVRAPAADGRRHYAGRLAAADSDVICVEADDGGRHELAYAAIDRARLVPEL